MTEDNVMEFCQWLVSEKGIEAGNLSDYINNNEEEVLKLAEEFKKPKFKVGGKVESAAEKFQNGGKTRKQFKDEKLSRKELKTASSEKGYTNGQFNDAYYSAKMAFRNNGLSRRDAKLAAQRSLMNRTANPVVEDAPTNPHYSYQVPTKSYSYTDFNEMELKPMNITPMGYDTMSFNDAFASARRAGGNTGNNTFRWRGKLYGTKLAGEVNGNTNKAVDLKNNYDLNIDEEPMNITPMGYDAMSLNSAFARAWEQRSKTGKKHLKYNGKVYDLDEIENVDLGEDFASLEEGSDYWKRINGIPYFYWNNGKVIKPGQYEYDKWINDWIDYYKSNPGPKSEGYIEMLSSFLKCGGKVKKKVKKHANGEPITIPVKLDETRTGTVTYNPDGTRKETIRRITEQWQGTASPSEAVTHRVVTPDSTAMYVQYGPVDEENRRGYLYNTARNMGAREKANQAKFDDRFNELFRRANFRVTTLPNGKMVINDVVHTDNDTLSRTIDQGDTTIVNSAGDRFSNNSIKTRLARKIFGTSSYDQANKNFEMIDEMQRGGEVSNNKFDRFINRIIPAKQRRIDDSRKQGQYMHKYFLESMDPLQQEVKPLLEELMNLPAPDSYNMLPNKTTKIDNKKLAEYINQLTKK